MSLSKFSKVSGSSSDDSDLELLLSQVRRKRARRRLSRETPLMKDKGVDLPSIATVVRMMKVYMYFRIILYVSTTNR